MQADIDAWFNAVAALYGTAEDSRGDAHTAYEALANEWSGLGYPSGPEDLAQLVRDAAESGYMFALRDLRGGRLDEIIRESRLNELTDNS